MSTPTTGQLPRKPLTADEREFIRREFWVAAQDAANLTLRWQLATLRRHHGLTVEQVAERMGVDPEDVIRDMEMADSDPHLSTIRRYALAIGARIGHEVHMAVAEPDEAAQPTQPTEGASE